MHAARSRVIDAFVSIEEAASFLLDLAQIEQNGDPLGTKIGKLQAAESTASYGVERFQRVRDLLKNAATLVDIRNSIVHASMKLVPKSQTVLEARFSNPKRTSDGTYMTVALELAGLKFVADYANQLADELTDPQVNKPIEHKCKSIWVLIAEAQALPLT
jgi:hypothetical protein